MLQVRDLIKLLENSNLGSPSWLPSTLMTGYMKTLKFVQVFFLDGAMNSNDGKSGN
jgi:hypothetical protein